MADERQKSGGLCQHRKRPGRRRIFEGNKAVQAVAGTDWIGHHEAQLAQKVFVVAVSASPTYARLPVVVQRLDAYHWGPILAEREDFLLDVTDKDFDAIRLRLVALAQSVFTARGEDRGLSRSIRVDAFPCGHVLETVGQSPEEASVAGSRMEQPPGTEAGSRKARRPGPGALVPAWRGNAEAAVAELVEDQ